MSFCGRTFPKLVALVLALQWFVKGALTVACDETKQAVKKYIGIHFVKMLSLVKVSDFDSSCIYRTCKDQRLSFSSSPTDDVKASSGRRLGSNGLKNSEDVYRISGQNGVTSPSVTWPHCSHRIFGYGPKDGDTS